MYVDNPFAAGNQLGNLQVSEERGTPQSSAEERMNRVGLHTLTSQDLVLLEESGITIDHHIMLEQNEEMKFLLSEVQALQDIMQDFSYLVEEQQETLDQIEEHTESAVVETEKADEHLTVAVEEKKKSRRAGVGAVIGGGTGITIGLIGFAVNPVVGILTLLVGGALGTSVGAGVGMATKK
jgi:molecular chaperone DnaK (HSP70)